MRIRPRWIVLGGSTLATTAYLAHHNWDLNALGAVRFGRAAFTAAAISMDYKYRVYGKDMPDDEAARKEIWSAAHKRAAERLLRLCEANKGVFIKVGQHIAALDYLLPKEYVQTMQALYNHAPESSFSDVQTVIKEDLKGDTDSLFLHFEKEPLGAASLAQVYKAVLKNGETVAVKVQHRTVYPHSHVDIETMDILVNIAAKMFPDFKLLWLAEETKKNLPLELDFTHEGRNSDKLRELSKDDDWLKVPKVHWNMTTRRILVMDYIEGGNINDLEYMQKNKISTRDVCDKVGKLYSKMIFDHGFVHCDPHPGNIIVRKRAKGDAEICLLDHGLYTQLDPQTQYSYSQLWLSIINSDVEGIKKHSEELNVGDLYILFSSVVTGRSWDSISKKGGIAQQKFTKTEEGQIRQHVAGYIPEISDILDRVPRPLILIFKTNELIKGVESALGTQKSMQSFMTMSKFCTRMVYKEKIRMCTTYFCYIRYKLTMAFTLAKINVFQWYLWLQSIFNPSISL